MHKPHAARMSFSYVAHNGRLRMLIPEISTETRLVRNDSVNVKERRRNSSAPSSAIAV